jgi:uncharacterized protein DUF6544
MQARAQPLHDLRVMRIAVTLLLALHGVLHLLGLVRANGARIGLAWMFAAGLFLIAAVLTFARPEWWWVVAAVALILSQALIVLQWREARAGTIPNVLILLPVVVAAATALFNRDVDGHARALLARAAAAPAAVVRPDELERLPAPVRRWLEVSGVVGRERVRTVRLQQRGEMRTGPDEPWMPVMAEQYFTVDPPGFVWSVDATMMRVLPIVGRDEYTDGRGHMLIKMAGLITVADATGPEIDQGTLLRFLGEIVWFPSAALQPYISWQEVDARNARATMSFGGVTASALFSFDERGRFVRLTASRYMGSGKEARVEEWVTPSTAWRVVRGVEMPVAGDAVWKLASGDFNYYRWEIVDVEPDRPILYGRGR